MSHEDLTVFIRWKKFMGWFFDATEKFPRRIRPTLTIRMENLTLDVLERIVEAAYSRNKTGILRQANLDVEKLRVLFAICHQRKHLSNRAYEHAVKELYETGKMLGGWAKERRASETGRSSV